MAFRKDNDNDTVSDGSRAINRFRVSDAVMMLVVVLLCLTCILPFIHLAVKSISGNAYVMAKQIYFLPKGLTFDAYTSVWKDGTLPRSMLFTVVMVLIFTLLGMVACICAAYPLSKKRLEGRTLLTFILMFPMYFGAGLIPSYLLIQKLHLYDTMWVLILPLIYSPYNMLIMKTYFQTNLPDSLEESAFLDGATNFDVLFRIAIPLSKPILATIALFYAVGRWNAYADAQYFIKSPKLKPVQLVLSQMVSSANSAQSEALSEAADVTSTPEVLQAASVMFVTIPIICVYPFLQKYFVKGVMIGAVKG